MKNKTQDCFVLIRGLIRESRHWGDFTDELCRTFPDMPVLTPDIPGNGKLFKQSSPRSIAAMTDALRKRLGYPANIHLIAISMGGMIAIDWMQRYPQEIRSAVLINTSVRPLAPFYQRLRWQVYPAIFKLLLQKPDNREHSILKLTANLKRNAPDILRQWRQWQHQCPVSPANASNQLYAAARFKIGKQKPAIPILVVCSQADRLVDYRCSLALQHHWHTDYRQHPTAGHDLPLDDPTWLTETIRDWQHHQNSTNFNPDIRLTY